MSPIVLFRLILCASLPLIAFTDEESPLNNPTTETDHSSSSESEFSPAYQEEASRPTSRYWDEDTSWYFEAKPGFYYLTDSTMRGLYGSGGLSIRGEIGHRLKGPFAVWLDGGYFNKEGHAIGGHEKTEITLGTMTCGLKAIFSKHQMFSAYFGLGPRLFLALIDNQSPFVSNDNAIGIGGGFCLGAWLAPIPQYPNLFFDFSLDYSLKTLEIDEDEISSHDFDIDVSGLTASIGLGFRF